MAERKASAVWQGDGKTGKGTVTTETGVLKDQPYGFATRFGDDRSGTNPEELLGAAHAACFTMAFAFAAERAGFVVERASTRAQVRLAKDGEGFAIDRIVLTLEAKAPGLSEAQFQELADGAKNTCPLSKALAGVEDIVLETTLLS
ncbi:MAG: Peroxiredoxin OsmC [Paracidovorax wautersii]|uniref:Peroxiredoxin OsmC n=1 Tax=Paracidovorax wautersii TaxID=1177982 RepID=A0A7V8FMN8_9BURK|nr:MAG: Peroxiredoxin OsmC [Paracidovorax wautersii]